MGPCLGMWSLFYKNLTFYFVPGTERVLDQRNVLVYLWYGALYSNISLMKTGNLSLLLSVSSVENNTQDMVGFQSMFIICPLCVGYHIWKRTKILCSWCTRYRRAHRQYSNKHTCKCTTVIVMIHALKETDRMLCEKLSKNII